MPDIEDPHNLISSLGKSRLSPSAYDTAYFAMASANHGYMFPKSLKKLLEMQRSDGSWGSEIPYWHDRMINTLAAIYALENLGGTNTEHVVSRARNYIEHNLQKINSSKYETIGFEFIFPYLLKKTGYPLHPLPPSFQNRLKVHEKTKLKFLPSDLYATNSLFVHNSEILESNINIKLAKARQERDGSMAGSPAATINFYLTSRDKASLHYLNHIYTVFRGGSPTIFTIDLFEINWALENFSAAPRLRLLIRSSMKKQIEKLAAAWKNHSGISHSFNFSVPCGDDTFLAIKNLYRFAKKSPDLSTINDFEGENGFRSFPYEYNISISTHAHLLSCLTALPVNDFTRRLAAKTRKVISKFENLAYWFDKWHVSPLYATSKIFVAELQSGTYLNETMAWIKAAQNDDGGWGFYDRSTCEETAFAIHALYAAVKNGIYIDPSAVLAAKEYLKRNYNSYSYPALWLGKTLYSPISVVDSYILSALDMADYLSRFYCCRTKQHEEISIYDQLLFETASINNQQLNRIKAVMKTVSIIFPNPRSRSKQILATKFLLWLFAIDDFLDKQVGATRKKISFINKLRQDSRCQDMAQKILAFGHNIRDELEDHPNYRHLGKTFERELDSYFSALAWELKNRKKIVSRRMYMKRATITMGFRLYALLVMILDPNELVSFNTRPVLKTATIGARAARLANDIRSYKRDTREHTLNYFLTKTPKGKVFSFNPQNVKSTQKKIEQLIEESVLSARLGQKQSCTIPKLFSRLARFVVIFYSKTDFTDSTN